MVKGNIAAIRDRDNPSVSQYAARFGQTASAAPACPAATLTCGDEFMAWLYLITAGLFEIAWPVGLKLAQTPGRVALGLVIAVTGMAVSGFLLWLAQRTIPMGTAYAVWTGIGATGAFLVGVMFYGDSASAARLVSVSLIVAGIIGLKLAHSAG